MAVGEEIGAAVGSLTALERLAAGASRAALAGGLAFYPVVGLVLGALAAGVATATERVLPAAAGPAGVLALVALAGARGALGLAAAAEALLRRGDAVIVRGRLRTVPGPLGIAAAGAALAARAAAAAGPPPPAPPAALLPAPLLGAGAVVVEGYGGGPTHASRTPAAIPGRAPVPALGWAGVTAPGETR